jgi:hypothetical protein
VFPLLAGGRMSRTPFYAIDQEHLPERYWDLADRFAELHQLVHAVPDGVARITVADIAVVLDLCEQTGGELLRGPHGSAVARLRAAIEEPSRRV